VGSPHVGEPYAAAVYLDGPQADGLASSTDLHIPAFARMAFGDDEGESGPSRRRTVLLAWSLALAALASVAPFVAAAVALGLVLVARLVESVSRAVERSRERRGSDRGGVALQVLALPWHVVKATVLTVPSAVLAAALAAGIGYVGWWLTREFLDPVLLRAGVLVIAAVAVLVLLSRGPLTDQGRAGAHRVAAALSPSRGWAVAWVIVALATVVACAGIALAGIVPLAWPLASGTLGP